MAYDTYQEWLAEYGGQTAAPDPSLYAQYGIPMPTLEYSQYSPELTFAQTEAARLQGIERDLIEAATKKELRTDVGLSAGLLGLELLTKTVDTPAQRAAKEELAELQRQVEAGEPALDPKVKALKLQAGTAAGRMASEMGMRQTAQEAAVEPGGISAGALQRTRQNVMETVAKEKRATGLDLAASELQAEQLRGAEIASREAQEREEEFSKRDAAAVAVSKAAIWIGEQRGEKPLEVADIQSLKDAGFDNKQIMEIWKESKKSMRSQDKYMEYMLYAGQFGPTSAG